VQSFHTFKSFQELALGIYRSFSVSGKIASDLKAQGITDVVFPMPHIWDLIVWMRLSKSNLKIIRFIHDHEAHKGELFPPKWFVSMISRRSKIVVCFSKYVAMKIETSKVKPIVADLPPLIVSKQSISAQAKKDGLLFLGRIHEYKGLELLKEAYIDLHSPRPNLTIAGFGTINHQKFQFAKIINRWLSGEEIVRLLRTTDVLLLPYLEATQSGIIPIAKQFNVKIVFTPVGGLAEQVSDYPLAVMARSTDPADFSQAIKKAMEGKFDRVLTNSGSLKLVTVLDDLMK
jgi:glycosyltransferase involved in cell wall biosynthesis